ncbi:unnamed protein product, partial [Lymnaea stagnalis]
NVNVEKHVLTLPIRGFVNTEMNILDVVFYPPSPPATPPTEFKMSSSKAVCCLVDNAMERDAVESLLSIAHGVDKRAHVSETEPPLLPQRTFPANNNQIKRHSTLEQILKGECLDSYNH